MSGDEIRELWLRLDRASMAPETATAFRLLLLLGQRVEEILGARWQEIDFERRVLDIPARADQDRRRRRAGGMWSRCRTWPSTYADDSPAGPVCLPRARRTRRTRTRTAADPVPQSEPSGRPLLQPRGNPFPRFTPRDIRRTIKTRLSEIGVLKEIRDRVQNHALHDVASKHYDRFDYLADKRAALEGWEWELRRILAGRPTSEEWKRWLRRFVREPDNEFPGRQLARLLATEPDAADGGGAAPAKAAAAELTSYGRV